MLIKITQTNTPQSKSEQNVDQWVVSSGLLDILAYLSLGIFNSIMWKI